MAGNGTGGFSGDNGLAGEAQLNAPSGLALDSNGTLYIADSDNNRVRKVTTGPSRYHVAISNSGGTLNSATANVNVLTPPSIAIHPMDTNATTGATVVMGVNAMGTAPLTYQWQKNNVNIAGAIGTSYSLTNAQSDDNGTYRVVVSNAVGSVTSNGATLTVSLPGSLAEFTHGLTAQFSRNTPTRSSSTPPKAPPATCSAPPARRK